MANELKNYSRILCSTILAAILKSVEGNKETKMDDEVDLGIIGPA